MGCTLLTRRSAFVLQMGVLCRWQALKRILAHSVAVAIAT